MKGALEALPFVTSAKASHEKGTVALTLSGEFNESEARSAIEAAGYKYKGIHRG